ncbi:hypothetical protein QYM36_005505 [Artemia franciscana]|uniref:DDE-1 domain-containing protein n=1 Tax=Artemia franciscana TaxID=6661 RepID=A0AA88IAD9_ARTSF|nr:hypothetical protein QYM36_005505 [Artemia franciscana]
MILLIGIWISLTKKPMKPIIANPIAVAKAIFWNSEKEIVFIIMQSVLKKTPFTASNILNCNETSVTTVHVPPKVFAKKGRKIVGKVTSAEHGVLVTMIGTISASWQYFPPYLIFPCKKFQPLMLTGAPANSAGGASPSGWVNQELFLEYLKHFKTYSHASPESPKLLIMDNHESHICSAVCERVWYHFTNNTTSLQPQVAAIGLEPGNNLAKTPSTNGPEQSSTPVSVPVTPEQVQPYPKAKPRVLSGRGRKKGSTKILTDTPVKRQIEEQEAKRKDKKAREGSDDEKMILDDLMKLGESEDESEKEEEIFDSVSTGDFVKVVYEGEYFPGSVQEKNENSVKVSVMCMASLRKWKWPD